MPRSERLLRRFERLIAPWFDREAAEKAEAHAEALHKSSIAIRKEAEEVIETVSTTTKLRRDYKLMADRLAGR